MDGAEQLKISFPWGLPGLEEYREFTLNALAKESPFYFLQAVRQQKIGLMLVNPYAFFENYEFELSDDTAGQLKLDDEKKVAILCVVNTSCGVKSATVNLLAPVIINTERWLAKQVVLNDRKYSLQTPLACGTQEEER